MGENIQVVTVNFDLTRNIWCFKYKVRHTRCAREKCEGAPAKEGARGHKDPLLPVYASPRLMSRDLIELFHRLERNTFLINPLSKGKFPANCIQGVPCNTPRILYVISSDRLFKIDKL